MSWGRQAGWQANRQAGGQGAGGRAGGWAGGRSGVAAAAASGTARKVSSCCRSAACLLLHVHCIMLCKQWPSISSRVRQAVLLMVKQVCSFQA